MEQLTVKATSDFSNSVLLMKSYDKAKLLAELELRLGEGIVHFVYAKSGGVPREAIGTKSKHFIPNTKLTDSVVKELENATDNMVSNMVKAIANPDILREDPDGFKYGIDILHGVRNQAFGDPEAIPRSYTPNDNIVNYYDFESKGWRAFNKESILMVY